MAADKLNDAAAKRVGGVRKPPAERFIPKGNRGDRMEKKIQQEKERAHKISPYKYGHVRLLRTAVETVRVRLPDVHHNSNKTG